MFEFLNSQTFKLIKYAVLCMSPYITWKYFYDTYKEDLKRYEEAVLFQKRHNCVVMYRKGNGHSGWPTITLSTGLNIKNIETLFEPFLYFIETAEKSLDIAIMTISVKSIIDALIRAHNKGVKVRVISNFYMNVGTSNYYKTIKRQDIPITFYVSKDKTNSIMHTKFIVKDFEDTGGGYLATGSFNMTYSAFSFNYEDVIFTSKRVMVEEYHNNFEKLWEYFIKDNTNTFNRLILENAGFIS